MLEDVLTLSQKLGNKHCVTIAVDPARGTAWSVTDRARAGRLFRRAVALAARLGDRPSPVRCLHGLARLSQAEGDLDRATRLLAAAKSVAPGESGQEDGVAAHR